jgi:hypothetical protein
MHERAPERQWETWPEDRESGVRWRLRTLFAPTDAGDAVAERIADHGRALEARSAELSSVASELEAQEARVRELHTKVERMLREGSAELDVRQSELEARASELDRREAALADEESRLEDRRREVGAVELRGAALARREDALRSREVQLELRARELAELAARLDRLVSLRDASDQPVSREDAHLVFTVGDRYRLVERDGAAPRPGADVELEDGRYRCFRVTGSPFPSDSRRCALLERLPEPVSD